MGVYTHLVFQEKETRKNKKTTAFNPNKRTALPISSFKELLQTLEALNYDPAKCYFKTSTFEGGNVAVDNICFLQRENQWVVCLADWHSFSDEQSFDSEQEACENFVYKYFLLSKEEINWLKQ